MSANEELDDCSDQRDSKKPRCEMGMNVTARLECLTRCKSAASDETRRAFRARWNRRDTRNAIA
jgi:hypothetical protein